MFDQHCLKVVWVCFDSAKMTPEEKEEYLKQKKEERKKKLNAMLKNKRLEQNRVNMNTYTARILFRILM